MTAGQTDAPGKEPAPTGEVAAPPLPPPPGPEWQPLVDAVAAVTADFPGRISVVAVNLATGERWEYRATQCYHPASGIKIPVALYATRQVRAGILKWDHGIAYTEDDLEAPAGPFAGAAPGTEYSVRTLVDWSIRYSNNTAVNMLGRHLGWGRIRSFAREIGGPYSPGPWVNAQSAANWWIYLWELSQEDPVVLEPVLTALREVTYRGRIAAAVPAGVSVLHKYGSYAGYEHDAGIVYGKYPFLLVVFTAEAGAAEADQAIIRITRGAWQALGR